MPEWFFVNPQSMDLFRHRTLIIATKHDKQRVLAPLLEQHLGVYCNRDAGIDTDVLGTFSGEQPRELDPFATACRKCEWAMCETGCDLAIANEGSFYMHPIFGFVPVDDELLVLKDQRHEALWKVAAHTTETNFAAREVDSWIELQAFAQEIGFPSHGLILRPGKSDFADMAKGLVSWDMLQHQFSFLRSRWGRVYAETDMRASFNPTRMRFIGRLCEQLLDLLKQPCPNCSFPGYGPVASEPGLPCAWCRTPTRSRLLDIYLCQHCGFEQKKYYPDGKQTEDPMYCERCNP